MTLHSDKAPPAVVRSRPMGANGLPDDRIEDETVSEAGGDRAAGSSEVGAEYGDGPYGAPTSSYTAWVAVGAVICGAAGALTAWSRSRRQEAMRLRFSTSVPSHVRDVTPPHGDPLSSPRKRP